MHDMELLPERLERLAIVLDELMPQCAELVRDALALLEKQEAVVRCRDCRRYYANGGNCDQVLADWFCADGVAKER